MRHSQYNQFNRVIRSIQRLINESKEQSDSPFQAIADKDIRKLQRSLKHGFNVEATNEEGDTLAVYAVKQRDYRALELLLDNGASTFSVFERFIEDDDYDSVAMIIDCGGDINCVANDGNETPIIIAVLQDNVEIVKLLLNNGCNVSGKDSRGRDAVKIAKQDGLKDCLEVLQKKLSDTIIR